MFLILFEVQMCVIEDSIALEMTRGSNFSEFSVCSF